MELSARGSKELAVLESAKGLSFATFKTLSCNLTSINNNLSLLTTNLTSTTTDLNDVLIRIEENSFKSVVNTELCLPNGDIVIKREIIDLRTGNTLIVKFFTLSGSTYTGDLTQLDNMICCCNKTPEIKNGQEVFNPNVGDTVITVINHAPATIVEVIRNGIEQVLGIDYTVSGNQVTLLYPINNSSGAIETETIIIKYTYL